MKVEEFNQKFSPKSFDDVLEKVGSAGRWQLWVTLICVISFVFQALQDFFYAFIITVPDHYCRIPGIDSWDQFNESTQNLLKDWALPRSKPGSPYNYSRCEIYDRDYGSINWTGIDPWSRVREITESTPNASVVQCKSWQFDVSEGELSIVTAWDLVCNREGLIATAQAVYMAGQIIGSTFYGYLADRFGRRKAVIPAILNLLCSSILSAFSTHYIMYAVLRFITGFASSAFLTVVYIIVTEVCCDKIRHITGTLSLVPYMLGYFILAALSFGITQWNYFQLAVSVPVVVLLAYIFILPESPRWLLSNGKTEKAAVILKKAAKMNRKKLADSEIDDMVTALYEYIQSEGMQHKTKRSVWSLAKTLFRTPEMRKRTLVSYYHWLANGLVLFGTAYSAPTLGGDPNLTSLLLATAQVVATIFCCPLLIFLGRKPSTGISFFFAALGYLLPLAIPLEVVWARQLSIILGQFASTIGYVVIALYAAELFPNNVRNFALGTTWTCTQLGALSAAYIAQFVAYYMVEGPFIIYGILCFFGAIVTIFLPETQGVELPHNVDEVENHGKDFSLKELNKETATPKPLA